MGSISPESQFRPNSALIFCNLPHLYPTRSSETETSELEKKPSRAYNALISLLQTNFRLCKNIRLVRRTDRDLVRKQRARDAMMARVEKVFKAEQMISTVLLFNRNVDLQSIRPQERFRFI